MTNTAREGNVYDFRAPRRLADDVESMLGQWHAGLGTRITDIWEQQLSIQLEWQHEDLATTRRSILVSEWKSTESPLVHVVFGYESELDSIVLAVPRTVLLAALAMLLGDSVQEAPDDRALTEIELAVLEIGWQHFAQAMTDSQPCDRPLVCEYRGMRSDRDCAKTFTEQEPVAKSQFRLQTAFGEQFAECFLSQQAVLQIMTRISECQTTSSAAEDLEEALKELPIGLVVRLGTASVNAADLMNLQPGDVLLLEQRVDEPLPVQIGPRTKFRGWPGRIGNRQALQVSQVVVEE